MRDILPDRRCQRTAARTPDRGREAAVAGAWEWRAIGCPIGLPRLPYNRSPDHSTESPAMDRETFDATIRTFKHRTPFRPFTISLVNGERLEVDHPDAISRAGRGGHIRRPWRDPLGIRLRGGRPSRRGLGQSPARVTLESETTPSLTLRCSGPACGRPLILGIGRNEMKWRAIFTGFCIMALLSSCAQSATDAFPDSTTLLSS